MRQRQTLPSACLNARYGAGSGLAGFGCRCVDSRRSATDALTEAGKLRRRGVHFKIATLNLDTSTPIGFFIYTMMSALAEFERNMLSQRTREGLAAARKRGAKIGRPPVLTDNQLRQARRRVEQERISINRLAGELCVHGGTLARALRRQEQRSGRPAPS